MEVPRVPDDPNVPTLRTAHRSCGSPDSGNSMARSAGSDGSRCGKSKHSFDEGPGPGNHSVEDKSVRCDLGDLEFTGAWEKSRHEVTGGSYRFTRYLQYIILNLDSRSICNIINITQLKLEVTTALLMASPSESLVKCTTTYFLNMS